MVVCVLTIRVGYHRVTQIYRLFTQDNQTTCYNNNSTAPVDNLFSIHKLDLWFYIENPC